MTVIPTNDYCTLATCALRYALGRHTYIVDTVCNIVVNNIHELSYEDLWHIRRDVEAEIPFLKDTLDWEFWSGLLASVEVRIKELEKEKGNDK